MKNGLPSRILANGFRQNNWGYVDQPEPHGSLNRFSLFRNTTSKSDLTHCTTLARPTRVSTVAPIPPVTSSARRSPVVCASHYYRAQPGLDVANRVGHFAGAGISCQVALAVSSGKLRPARRSMRAKTPVWQACDNAAGKATWRERPATKCPTPGVQDPSPMQAAESFRLNV
jgi:hypothetical protein